MEIKYNTYTAYKDSGVEWLGEIPERWSLSRLAAFGSFSKGGGFSKNELISEGVKAVLYGDIYSKYSYLILDAKRCISEETSKKSVQIEKGDILFTGSGETKEDIGKCVLFYGEQRTFAGGDVIIFKQKANYPHYLKYILNSNGVISEKIKTAKGEIIVHTYGSKLRLIKIPIPPLPEQTAIANFLDNKTAKIDQAIAQKEKLIELLKERKQILIQNAVTKGLPAEARAKAGLDPNVKMKDSGVEWIGEIPEHWEVVRNNSLFSEQKQPGREGLPLLSVSIHSAVSTEELDDDDNIRGKIKIEDKSNYKYVNVDYITYNMMRAWQGAIGSVRIEGMVSPAYIVAKPTNKIISIFFEFQYRTSAFIQQMNCFSKGITDFRKRLYWDEFKQLKTVLPPVEEQKIIVSYIQTQSTKIDRAIILQQSQIEKLKEYKATLIDGAVTGKIRVT